MIDTPTYPSLALPEIGRQRSGTNPKIIAFLSSAALAALWVAGSGTLLRVAYPAAAALLALVLYRSNPIAYVKYSLWIWFITPLVRRIVDIRCGWAETNLVLLAPFLVSAVVMIAFVTKGSRAWNNIPIEFVLCAAAILYGFVVGLLVKPSVELCFGLLNWICPLVFGLHLYQNWDWYEQYREAIGRTFVSAALIMGTYGVFQFLNPPSWDRFWLENVQRTAGTSFGQPEALLVRVWSTMNAPGPFANTMMMGLILLFAVRSSWKLPAAITGYTSFLLSAVRTAWLSWIIGLVWILKSASPRVITRIIVSVGLLVVCLIPVMSDSRLATVISNRLDTFTDLQHDDSFGARMEMYRILGRDALENPFGEGLQVSEVSRGIAVDSGFLLMLFSLGWIGTLVFGAGVFGVLARAAQSGRKKDEFQVALKAGMIGLVAQLVGGNIFVGVSGTMFWMFAGMYLASAKYNASTLELSGEGKGL
ncbi:MAG TPA: O-antigen ligase family protein [Terriglobales bacterium]|nr:O-antigen ligase family protein [Terriglobales bacterium]